MVHSVEKSLRSVLMHSTLMNLETLSGVKNISLYDKSADLFY